MSETKTAVYQAILHHKQANDGASPSIRELMTAVGAKSTASIHYHLGQLEKDGLVRRDPNQPRTIRVTGGQWVAPS
jgi:SOS-response transcriptional repressor LexA